LHELLQAARSSTKSCVNPKHFTRDGALTLPVVVALLLTMVSDAGRRGYDLLVEHFWSAATLARVRLPRKKAVTGEAFCLARKKVPWVFLRQLLHKASARFQTAFGAQFRWKGRQVFAIDGTRLPLLRDKSLFKAFGSCRGAGRPMTTISVLFDVFSRVPADVTFGPHASSERDHLYELLDAIPAGSVLVLDRGYPGFVLFCELRRRGIDFIVRSPTRHCFGGVRKFVRSGLDHDRIPLINNRRFEHPDLPDEISVRAVRLREGKQTMVLLTSLSGRTASCSQLTALYKARWNIEGAYKILKVDGFGVDTLHSKSVDGVKQEVAARLIFMTLSQHLLAQAARWSHKKPVDLAPKAARSELSHVEVLLLLTLGSFVASTLIARCLESVAESRAEKRKERSFQRRSHKPRNRWDLKGKTSLRGR
jgi:hypothetical protein